VKVLGQGSIAQILEVGLNILWVILWVALGLMVFGSLTYAGAMALTAAGVLSPEMFEGARYKVNLGGSEVTFESDEGLAWQVVAPALIGMAIGISGLLIIIDRLRRLFASFRSAEPFRKENATHLRVIWVTMAVLELSRYALLLLTGGLLALFGQPPTLRGSLDMRVNVTAWIAIFVLIVLAEVFREGARLREEQDLTI